MGRSVKRTNEVLYIEPISLSGTFVCLLATQITCSGMSAPLASGDQAGLCPPAVLLSHVINRIIVGPPWSCALVSPE